MLTIGEPIAILLWQRRREVTGFKTLKLSVQLIPRKRHYNLQSAGRLLLVCFFDFWLGFH
jgi:hypothetical protein